MLDNSSLEPQTHLSVAKDSVPDDIPPYQYIKNNYSNTLGTRMSGLAGYTPPNSVYAAMYLGRLLAIVFVVSLFNTSWFLFTSGTLTTAVPQMLETIGTSLADQEFATALLHPLSISILFPFCSYVSALWSFSIAHELSKPHEEKYMAWIQNIKPPEDMYPPHEYWWSLAQDCELDEDDAFPDYLSLPEAPQTAPPAVREYRRAEIAVRVVSKYTTVMLFFIMAAILRPQIGPLLKKES